MIPVKRNSSEFKQVKRILEDHRDKATRKRLILLYALKPSANLSDRILINKLKENAAVLYDMNYQTLLDYFADARYKLFREDRSALYYFKTSAGSPWLQVPFELSGQLRKQVFPLKPVKS